jgi:hypothetical protein
MVDHLTAAAQPGVASATKREDSAALRVLFASRGSNRSNTTARLLLNEQELLQRCNDWKPPSSSIWTKASCSSHTFGGDMMYDIALAR